MVDLPAPDGPSMAMLIVGISCMSLYGAVAQPDRDFV